MSQINEQLMTVFTSGTGLISTASNQINASYSKITNVSEALTNLSVAITPLVIGGSAALTEIEEKQQSISNSINTVYLLALTSYTTNLSTLNAHIEERLDLMFEELSVSSAISQLSEYSDVDATVNSIAGSVLGQVNAELLAGSTLLDELLVIINDINTDNINLLQLTELELLLSQAIDELNSYGAIFLQTVSDESDALSTLYTRYKQYSKAVSATLMMSDDSLSGFITQLASADLQTALAC